MVFRARVTSAYPDHLSWTSTVAYDWPSCSFPPRAPSVLVQESASGLIARPAAMDPINRAINRGHALELSNHALLDAHCGQMDEPPSPMRSRLALCVGFQVCKLCVSTNTGPTAAADEQALTLRICSVQSCKYKILRQKPPTYLKSA